MAIVLVSSSYVLPISMSLVSGRHLCNVGISLLFLSSVLHQCEVSVVFVVLVYITCKRDVPVVVCVTSV